MEQLTFHKKTQIPQVLDPNGIYFIKSDDTDVFDIFITDGNGVPTNLRPVVEAPPELTADGGDVTGTINLLTGKFTLNTIQQNYVHETFDFQERALRARLKFGNNSIGQRVLFLLNGQPLTMKANPYLNQDVDGYITNADSSIQVRMFGFEEKITDGNAELEIILDNAPHVTDSYQLVELVTYVESDGFGSIAKHGISISSIGGGNNLSYIDTEQGGTGGIDNDSPVFGDGDVGIINIVNGVAYFQYSNNPAWQGQGTSGVITTTSYSVNDLLGQLVEMQQNP